MYLLHHLTNQMSVTAEDPISIVSEVWPTIVRYVDMEALISLSKSCHLLRNLVVDAPTGKIKASVIKVKEYEATEQAYVEGRTNHFSAPYRIPGFVSNMLNSIYSPSLTRLQMSFPAERTEWNEDATFVDNAYLAACPFVAQKVFDATNLEELGFALNDSMIVQHENALCATYGILGQNLVRVMNQSKKLKTLTLLNSGVSAGSGVTYYSSSFVHAMVPVITAGRCCLEEVTVCWGDRPKDSRFIEARKEFFVELFSLPKLKKLRLQLTHIVGPMLTELIDAATAVGTFPLGDLEEISLFVRDLDADLESDDHIGVQYPSVQPFLSLSRHVCTLRKFVLYTPPESWNENSIVELIHLLNRNQNLDEIIINFSGYEETSGRLLDFLWEYIKVLQQREALPSKIAFVDIDSVDEDSKSFRALTQFISPRDGEHCLRSAFNGDTDTWSYIFDRHC